MSEASTSAAPTVVFKKAPRRPQASRKRSASPPSVATPDVGPSSVVRPNLKSGYNPLVQGSKRRRDAADGEDADGDASADDLSAFRADEGGLRRADELATRSADWDLEGAEKADKKIRLNEDGEIQVDDGQYRGAANYLQTINKRTDVLDKKMTSTAPIRATANIRTITLVDYQPDVCKPYKETGFCGYGDSCKFMHDRGDYLAGWQLDALDPADAAREVEQEEEPLPFACLICRKEFADPVVTKCGHYFCMNCAVERYKKSPKCYACGAPTSGIFNKAEKILAKLEAKRKRRMEEKGIVEEDDGGIEIGSGSDEDDEGADDGVEGE
ncbi:RNA-splicing factor [Cryptotrichosporon argae]